MNVTSSAVRLLLAAALVFGATVAPAYGVEKVFYYHNDHLATPQMMTDDVGTAVWEAEYRPFGEATVNEDPDGNGILARSNIRFPGQYYDAETGQHYNWHRYYEPETGRYLQPDPIGIMRGENHLFAYGNGNPVSNVDPSGLVNWKGSLKGVAGVVVFGAGFFRFNLESECKCDRRVRISGYASTVAVGVGGKYSGSGGSLELYDYLACPERDAANGPAVLAILSGVVGAGGSFYNIQLGDLYSVGGGPSYGYDTSIAWYVGASVVTSSTCDQCGCDSAL